MLPVKTVRLQLGELLAADATTLAPPVNANEVALIAADFTPTEDLVIGDLTLATFTGSTPKNAGVGTQGVGNDPATGNQVITILDPAGGWRWECTVAPGAPETIFGIALTTDTGAALLGTQKLPTPIVIVAVGDQVLVGSVTMTINVAPIS